jgi:hypothetical protein
MYHQLNVWLALRAVSRFQLKYFVGPFATDTGGSTRTSFAAVELNRVLLRAHAVFVVVVVNGKVAHLVVWGKYLGYGYIKPARE